jgi:hypothetical protein
VDRGWRIAVSFHAPACLQRWMDPRSTDEALTLSTPLHAAGSETSLWMVYFECGAEKRR